MNRRTFFPWLTGGIGGSFIAGAIGGAAIGGGATAYGSAALRPWGRTSHSQQGEDLIVAGICRALDIKHPTYLDIGAADPCQDSNTFLFYENGFRGVLVEPNPAFCRKLRSKRPGDTVLNVGVGTTNQTEADYYMFEGGDGEYLNSFSKAQVDDIVKRSNGFRSVARVLKLPLVNINQIIAQNFKTAPTFVSIDTEGLDLDILRTLDFSRFRPTIFSVETIVLSTTHVVSGVAELMQSKNYSIRGGTFVNTIFVDNERLS